MDIYYEKTFSGQQTVLKTKNAIERGDEFDLYIIDEQLSDMSYSDIVSEIKNLTAMQKPIIVLSNTSITQTNTAGIAGKIYKLYENLL